MTDKKFETQTITLEDIQLDEVSGGMVNVVENPNKDMLGSAAMDKVIGQKQNTLCKNQNCEY